MSMKFSAIMPVPFNPLAFRFEMLETMESLMGGILHSFTETTRTWEEQPTFEAELTADDWDIKAYVYCDALAQGDRIRGSRGTGPIPAPINLVYFFLNYGTDIRYATMSPDFIPKTSVEWLNSRSGRGFVAGVSTRRPRPGIKARKWDEAIAKRFGGILENQLRRALIRGVRGSGHAFERS